MSYYSFGADTCPWYDPTCDPALQAGWDLAKKKAAEAEARITEATKKAAVEKVAQEATGARKAAEEEARKEIGRQVVPLVIGGFALLSLMLKR